MTLNQREIGIAAHLWAVDYELSAGRNPTDTSAQRGAPVDIVSNGRAIEVKGVGGSIRTSGFVALEPIQVQEALSNPTFHLYIVENVAQGDPALFRLLDLHGEDLALLLANRKERSYFDLPIPAAVYVKHFPPLDPDRGVTSGM